MKIHIDGINHFTLIAESDADHAILSNLNQKYMAISYEEGERASLYTTIQPTNITSE